MAKKKKQDSDEEDFEEIEEFENQEIESVYPKIETKGEASAEVSDEILTEEDEELQEDLDFVMEEEEEGPKYKYLNLEIKKGNGKNNYEIFIEGQSHGFLNVFVKHLLSLEAVDLAAYKKTDIEAPKIFLKLKEGHTIKKTLRDGIESLREEVVSAQKVFKDLM